MINENELPKNWEVVKLGDVCQKISLNGIKIKQKDYLENGKYPVVDQGQDLIGGYFDDENLIVPDEPPYIIFGDHTKVKKFINFKFIAGADGIKVLKPFRMYNARFFFYLLFVVKIPDKGYARHFQFLEHAEIPLPPLAEQELIVAKIEELFSELDAGLESLKTAQAQLKTYRQAVLKYAFESGEEVETIKLEDCCEFITKGTTPSKDKLFDKDGEVPFIKVYNLTFDGTLDFTISPTFVTNETHNGFLNRSKVIPNDVLMNIVGPPLGKVSIVPISYPEWNINQAIARFRCKDFLLNRYLLHYLTSINTIRQYSKKAKATAGQFNLTLEICRNITIPLCSLEEQQRIVEEIESRLSVCDKLEETINSSLKQAEALRQSILKQAFEGKLLKEIVSEKTAGVLS